MCLVLSWILDSEDRSVGAIADGDGDVDQWREYTYVLQQPQCLKEKRISSERKDGQRICFSCVLRGDSK